MLRFGPNAYGERLQPGRVADCHLGILLDQPLVGPSVWLAASQLAVLPVDSGVRRERRRPQRAYPLLRNSLAGSSHSPAKLTKPAAQRAARCGDAVSSQFARHGRFVKTPAFLSGADPDLTPGGEVP